MADYVIDCAQIATRDDLHRIFRESLCFPSWYGNNLDALHDSLPTLSGTLRLENWETAQARLGKYGLAAKKAIASAGLENTGLDILL